MRVVLGIEYDGTAYNGWQRQKTGTGIQALVEEAITRVADEPVEVVCAGRTDTGVHASAQVVHFDSSAQRTRRGWVLGVNTSLPDDINANWAVFVDDEFHARFSATSRTYRYLILNRSCVRRCSAIVPGGFVNRWMSRLCSRQQNICSANTTFRLSGRPAAGRRRLIGR